MVLTLPYISFIVVCVSVYDKTLSRARILSANTVLDIRTDRIYVHMGEGNPHEFSNAISLLLVSDLEILIMMRCQYLLQFTSAAGMKTVILNLVQGLKRQAILLYMARKNSKGMNQYLNSLVQRTSTINHFYAQSDFSATSTVCCGIRP